jgi:hypothetical protein
VSWFGSQAPDVDSDDYDPANPYGDDQFEEEEFDDQDPSADRRRGGAHRYGPLMDAFGNHYRQTAALLKYRSGRRNVLRIPNVARSCGRTNAVSSERNGGSYDPSTGI